MYKYGCVHMSEGAHGDIKILLELALEAFVSHLALVLQQNSGPLQVQLVYALH